MRDYCFEVGLNKCCDQANIPEKKRSSVLATLLSLRSNSDITAAATRKWLNGQTVPSVNLIPSICSALNCEPNELFDINTDNQQTQSVLRTTYYTNPKNPQVVSEARYAFMPVNDKQIYLILIGDKDGSVWNVDELRNKLITKIVQNELPLVEIHQIKAIVSVGQLSKRSSRVFDLWVNDSGEIETNFEHKSVRIDAQLIEKTIEYVKN